MLAVTRWGGGVARQCVFQASHIPRTAGSNALVQGRSLLGVGGARGIADSPVVAWLRPGAGLAWTGQGSRGMSAAAAIVDVDVERAAVVVTARCAQVSRVPPSFHYTPFSATGASGQRNME